MKERISSFFTSIDIHLKLNWNEFVINHKNPESESELACTRKAIRNEFKYCKGIYVYLDESDNVLYVGIGKLADRVRFHYYESINKYPGNNCEKHIKFFTQHQGVIKILWAVIENTKDQKYIESELIKYLQPKYELMKGKGLLY